jgi:hypothetical protein
LVFFSFREYGVMCGFCPNTCCVGLGLGADSPDHTSATVIVRMHGAVGHAETRASAMMLANTAATIRLTQCQRCDTSSSVSTAAHLTPLALAQMTP